MKVSSIINRGKEVERLIAVERPRLLQYACYRLGSMADAEDAVQDTLASLHYRMQEEDFVVGNLSAYLYRSLSNHCVSRQRLSGRLHLVSLDGQADMADVETEDFEQEYRRISQLLAEIPEEQAEVIRLRYYGDKTFKEIAQILNEPLTTVKSRFVYGLEKIWRGMRAFSDNV